MIMYNIEKARYQFEWELESILLTSKENVALPQF